jgi:hypothetical protein
MAPAFSLILLVAALVITMQRSAVWAFVMLYLPGWILFSSTKTIALPGLPDIDACNGIMYGILGGIALKGGERLNFRFGLCDLLMLVLSASAITSSYLSENIWTGVNTLGEQFLGVLMPYFLARAMFHDAQARRWALWTLIGVIGFLAFFALIEMRLWPCTLSRLLQPLGLYVGMNRQVLKRFHFFRTQLLFHHPIDTGNSCLLIAALIVVLAMTTSVGLKNKYVRLAIFAAMGTAFSSLSFTSWFGALAAVGMLGVLFVMPAIGRYLAVYWVVLLCGGIAMTLHLKNRELGEREETHGETVSDSTYIRAKIIQYCWPLATDAGAFGYGKTVGKSDLDLDSVDNSYMLFVLRRGFVYLGLILLVPLLLVLRATKVYRRCHDDRQRLPVAVAVCALLGIMVAMFTVWFGFVYATLWVILLGVAHSMMDVLNLGAPATAPTAPLVYRRRGVASRELVGA